jgi:DNA-directed RNA polymerase specialized sigma subunit
MNIVWHYLDKKQAAINVLKDYGNMEYIIENTDEDIAAIHEKIEAPRSSIPSGMPKVYNPKVSEERIVFGTDEIDVLKERYRQAEEYMKWFKPAWEALSSDEQLILTEFFVEYISKTEAAASIGDRLFLERAQVYRRKDKALSHLAVLLYGK